jgi:transposase-like protein
MGSERLALKNMGGETTEAWRAVLDDLVDRGLRRRRAFLIVDRAPGLEKAIAAVGVPVQRGTDHKHRNLLAHAPERLHDEISADYNDMIYAATPEEIAARRKAFIRKWRLRHRAVADSLEEAGDRLFTFTPCHRPSGAASRTTNAIERLHEEVQTADQSPDRAAVGRYCCDAVLGASRLRPDQHPKVDGRHTLANQPIDQPIDLAA